MKKQDNENLIQELTKRLDWYMSEASEEEFDADEVQTLVKLLDSLKADQGENIEDELPPEEALSDFWNYCQIREAEEKILNETAETEQSSFDEKHDGISGKDAETGKETKGRRILGFVRRHRIGVVAAAVVLAMILGGSWQVVANAEKHGGFFWWMDKNEEGTTMITSPEGVEKPVGNKKADDYYTIEEVPEEYYQYVELPLKLSLMKKYKLKEIRIIQYESAIGIYEFLENEDSNIIQFEIKIYLKEILRIRESYPEYKFIEELESNGITYEVFEKEELNNKKSYIVYFYCGNVKYAVTSVGDKNYIEEIAREYGMTVAKSSINN